MSLVSLRSSHATLLVRSTLGKTIELDRSGQNSTSVSFIHPRCPSCNAENDELGRQNLDIVNKSPTPLWRRVL